jgi:hypothetical protein
MISSLLSINVVVRLSLALMVISCGELLAVPVNELQVTGKDGWQTYSPAGASFSMQIPGAALPAQGHIFDHADEDRAYRLIKHGVRSRIYNFEIEKGGRRSFLVSILEVRTAKRTHRFITDTEAELINATIGDDIVRTKVARAATKDGEVTQWGYKRKGGLGDDDEDDGMVYVKRWRARIVVVVVDYDYAEAGDADVKAMLESLRQNKVGAT